MLNDLDRAAPCTVAIALPRTARPATAAGRTLDRSVLPIAERVRQGWTGIDVRKLQARPRFEIKAASVARDSVIVVVDDPGMGAVRAPGGPLATPTLEALARHRRGLA
jgi:hypothetical protein